MQTKEECIIQPPNKSCSENIPIFQFNTELFCYGDRKASRISVEVTLLPVLQRNPKQKYTLEVNGIRRLVLLLTIEL